MPWPRQPLAFNELEALLGRRPVEPLDKARDFAIVVERDELVDISDRERA